MFFPPHSHRTHYYFVYNFRPEHDVNKELCTVYYAPLNFRDIMLASGKLPPDALPGDLAGKVIFFFGF